MLGLIVFAGACSSQPISPTILSGIPGVAGTQTAAQNGGPNVEVTFTEVDRPKLSDDSQASPAAIARHLCRDGSQPNRFR